MSLQVELAVARRFLVLRHLLAPPRSLPGTAESVLAVIDRLGALQFDPIEVPGRAHDLALHARVGGYSRELTDGLLYGRRLLFEAYNKSLNLLPTRELPWYRVAWQREAAGMSGTLLEKQAPLAEKILGEIQARGPLSSAEFEQEAAIDWWWGRTPAVRAVLEALHVTGRLGVARREGNRRWFDLTERLYPADLLETRVPEREQQRHRLLSRHRGHGLLGASGPGELWLGIEHPVRRELRAELVDRGELVAVGVDGVRGDRYVIAEELPILAQAEREIAAESGSPEVGDARIGGAPRPVGDAPPAVAFIAPLDPFMWDRSLLRPFHDFDYTWEVYTPAAKRRWGYYVLPLLFGDRLVGRIEPRIDRKTHEVRLLSLGWEKGFDPLAEPGFTAAFGAALEAYLGFARASVLVAPPDRGHAALFREISRIVRTRRGD